MNYTMLTVLVIVALEIVGGVFEIKSLRYARLALLGWLFNALGR